MTDNKSDYLGRHIVDEFVQYVSRLLRGDEPLNFEYSFRRVKALGDFQFNGIARTLGVLFDRYHWKGQGYAENAAELRRIQRRLRQSLSSDPTVIATINKAVGAVMGWGLPEYAAEHNKAWARRHRHRLPSVLDAGVDQLQAEEPDYTQFSRDSSVLLTGPGRVRMNAGYTKVYSLLCEGIIIYDSRVGAALCWLVRRFLVSIGHPGPVPDELAFLWSAGNSSQNRNPNGNGYTFGQLSADGPAWARANVRASWILEKARLASGAAWCAGDEGLRKVECSLFMLGYRLPEEKGELDESARKSEPVKRGRGAKAPDRLVSPVPPNHIALVNTAGSFDIDELETLVRDGRGYILVGSTRNPLFEDTPLETLEYWLRHKAGNWKTMQATPDLYQKIIATGRFRLEKRNWPGRARKSNALVLVGDSRWPDPLLDVA